MRDTEFNLPSKIHWEKPRHVGDCYIYCTKENTRTGEVFTKIIALLTLTNQLYMVGKLNL